jgi:RNA recognition motif-containing protein
MNIYVSNLSSAVNSEELKKFFARYGIVSSINIILDRLTNRGRGFAFVQMADRVAGEKAIRELNGAYLNGQSLKLIEARKNER